MEAVMGKSCMKDVVPSFGYLRKILVEADEASSSRKELAEKLRVSTHTIQNIINGKDLPNLSGEEISRRRRFAWARTITRISMALNEDPWRVLVSAGIKEDREIRTIVDEEKDKFLRNNTASSGAFSPMELLARGLLLSMDEGGKADRKLIAALKDYLRRREGTPRRAQRGQLDSGSFCRSCMASLAEPENRGKSDELCRWCSDEQGNLLPRKQALEVMTAWFMSWQTGIDIDEARRRAEHYMRSMPAWASSWK